LSINSKEKKETSSSEFVKKNDADLIKSLKLIDVRAGIRNK